MTGYTGICFLAEKGQGRRWGSGRAGKTGYSDEKDWKKVKKNKERSELPKFSALKPMEKTGKGCQK